jgi:hypothetical protein
VSEQQCDKHDLSQEKPPVEILFGSAFVMGAIWGAGNETMPLAAGTAHGSAFQETVIRVVAYSSAPTGVISFALISWGLRSVDHTSPERTKTV